MRIVIAPDSFKGTLDAGAAAAALAAGWRSVRTGDQLVLRPMADGGEGTLAAVAAAVPGAALHEVPDCTGPDGRPVTGRYALLPDGTALVELATASGLPLMARAAPLSATTRGTGQTVAAALEHGARRLLIGLGGSASTDGGAGLLCALGLRITSSDGRPLPDGGGHLSAARRIDVGALRPPPPDGVVLLTDVTNPLLGPTGAAAVYGPQKGAGPAQVRRLEEGLARWAGLLGADPEQPGTGAAGGTGFGLAGLWGARTVPGAGAIADLLGLDAALAGADLLITGEGRYDATSRLGKVVGECVHRASRRTVPVLVVAGDAAADAPRADLREVLSLTRLAGSREAALADPAHWLFLAAARLARTAAPVGSGARD